jgi:hypothetical protein
MLRARNFKLEISYITQLFTCKRIVLAGDETNEMAGTAPRGGIEEEFRHV